MHEICKFTNTGMQFQHTNCCEQQKTQPIAQIMNAVLI